MAQHVFAPFLADFIDRHPALRRPLWWLEALLLRAIWALARVFSPERASRIGAALGRAIGPRHAKSKQIRENLTIAFPERDASEIEDLTREVWGTLGASLAEFAHLDRICGSERIELNVKGDIGALKEGGRSAIFVTGHMGQWQVAPYIATALGRKTTIVYKIESNPYIAALLERGRRVLGCNLIPKQRSARELMRELSEGNWIGVATDWRVDEGEEVPFFGIDVLTTTVPAKLALRFDSAFIPVRVENLGDARYRITVYEPLEPDDPGASLEERAIQLTRKMNEHYERWIRERPDQWCCTQRRFPKTYHRALR